MALLVTGAMGHIGYAVARQAAAGGERTVACDLKISRPDEAAALGSGVAWVACDLSDPAAVEKLASGHRIDACIHLAAVSNEAYARPNPLAAIHANVGGLANLLDIGRRQGWRRLVFASTGSVFQNRTDVTTPILEDERPQASDVYATTKYAGELIARLYRTQFDLSAATVRLSWVYGPPIVTDSPTRGPIPYFLRRALAGTAIREPSGADFAASFTFVEDAAAGLLAAWRAPRLDHDVYHLGPGVNFSAGEVAAAIRAAVPGAVLELGPGTEPWTTYTRLRAPLAGDRLRADAGFRVAHSLEDGIRAYADWMRAHPESYR